MQALKNNAFDWLIANIFKSKWKSIIVKLTKGQQGQQGNILKCMRKTDQIHLSSEL